MVISIDVAVSGVTVTLSGTSSRSDVATDASGKYSFRRIRNGNYTVNGGNRYDWGRSATSGSAGGAASYFLVEGRIMIGVGVVAVPVM
jgi:hypothetical protein